MSAASNAASNPNAYAKPLPRIDGPNRPFWDGLRAAKVMVQRCTSCGRHRFPAARHCSHCLSEQSEWQQVSGVGTVESFCTFHKAYWPSFADMVPYDVVQVRLDEGVQFFSNLVDVPAGGARIGMRVQASFEPVSPEVTLLKFRAA